MEVGAGISLSLTPVVTPAAWDSISTGVEGRPSEGLTNEIGDRYLLISSTPFLRSYWRRCSCKIREKTQFPSKNPGTYGSVLHASVCCCFVPKALGLFRVGQFHWWLFPSLPIPRKSSQTFSKQQYTVWFLIVTQAGSSCWDLAAPSSVFQKAEVLATQKTCNPGPLLRLQFLVHSNLYTLSNHVISVLYGPGLKLQTGGIRLALNRKHSHLLPCV